MLVIKVIHLMLFKLKCVVCCFFTSEKYSILFTQF